MPAIQAGIVYQVIGTIDYYRLLNFEKSVGAMSLQLTKKVYTFLDLDEFGLTSPYVPQCTNGVIPCIEEKWPTTGRPVVKVYTD